MSRIDRAQNQEQNRIHTSAISEPVPALAPGEALPPAARKPPLPALSGLRTLLAVNIMFFHFTPPHPAFLSPLIDNAFVFVGFFFLISGFVLAYNYADRPALSHRRFLVARFSRIYPTYALVLLLSIPFLLVAERAAHPRGGFLLGLVLTPLALQGWLPTYATFWNTVAWTVPAEFALYLVFPYLVRFLRSQAGRLHTPARLALAILLCWAIGIVPHTIYWLTNPDHLPGPADRFTYGFWLRCLKYTPPFYLCTFTAGMLLARLHAVLAWAATRRALAALAALVGLTLFFAFLVERVPYVLVHGALLLPLFALLLLGLADRNPVSVVFAWRPIVLFGETTFALYLLHFNAFLLLQNYKVMERLHVARFDPWISYAFIVVLAVLISRLYERPLHRLLLGRLNPRHEA